MSKAHKEKDKYKEMTLNELILFFRHMQKKEIRVSGEVIAEAMRRIFLCLKHMKKSFEILNDVKK